MSRYGNRILVIFVSVLFSGLVSAQERIQETRLLVQSQPGEQVLSSGGSLIASGALGSKLFVYTRFAPDHNGSNLFRLEALVHESA